MRKLIALALLGFACSPLMAAECSTTVKADDMMQYNVHSITVPKTCKAFKVTLQHVGKLPVTVMGHNWVLTRVSDEAGVISDGAQAGAADSYEKPGDTRIIAATKLIGGGQTTATTVPVAKLKAGEKYAFFCTCPGHASLMEGTLSLAN